MIRNGTLPDAYTFPVLLKASASLASLPSGLSVHQHIMVLGHAADVYIASSLIHMYSKCGDVAHAHDVFDQMRERNAVPWTAIISCYAHTGDAERAFSMFSQMRREGIQPNYVTILSLLSGVSELLCLQCVHAFVIQCGFELGLMVANSLLAVYSRCKEVELARKLFEGMSSRDTVSWNSLVSGYAQNGCLRDAIDLFNKMKTSQTKPDQQSFASVVSVLADDGEIKSGKTIHAQVVTSGFQSDMHVATTLLGMYLNYGDFKMACKLFDQVEDPDVISWTAMISGLVQECQANTALQFFHRMLTSYVMPSTATLASTLAACAQLGSSLMGACIHGFVIRRRMELDTPAYNSLLTMYAKCGHLGRCHAIFDRMKRRDVVSWNAIIGAYAQNGHLEEAFRLFNEMTIVGEKPDAITVVSLLQSCASMGVLHVGKWVHNFVIRNGLGASVLVGTGLLDMYSKCGDLERARRCFSGMLCRDLVSWSALISGVGSHGKGDEALKFFSDFLRTGIKPNHVVFLSVLAACSHAGLVSKGLGLFHSMVEDFGINPKMEHYACLVDLLCRGGRLEEAYKVVAQMIPTPSSEVLGILLDACKTQKTAKLGEVIAKEILELKPRSAGNYVRLAHCYASMGRWDGVGEAWTQMRSLGLKKTPGWSFIELHGIVAVFYMGHTAHPQYQEVLSVLSILGLETRDKLKDL